jgi:hypothetical protein
MRYWFAATGVIGWMVGVLFVVMVIAAPLTGVRIPVGTPALWEDRI